MSEEVKFKIRIVTPSIFAKDWEIQLNNYSIRTTDKCHFIYGDSEQKNLRQIIPLNYIILIDYV